VKPSSVGFPNHPPHVRLDIADLHMDAAAPPLDVPYVPIELIPAILQSMSPSDRLSCALVCKAWAEAVTRLRYSIFVKQRLQESDFTGLKEWLAKHGGKIQVLQLHECYGALTALPCAQLQNLLLCGQDEDDDGRVGTMRLQVDPSVWRDVGSLPDNLSLPVSPGHSMSAGGCGVSAHSIA